MSATYWIKDKSSRERIVNFSVKKISLFELFFVNIKKTSLIYAAIWLA